MEYVEGIRAQLEDKLRSEAESDLTEKITHELKVKLDSPHGSVHYQQMYLGHDLSLTLPLSIQRGHPHEFLYYFYVIVHLYNFPRIEMFQQQCTGEHLVL